MAVTANQIIQHQEGKRFGGPVAEAAHLYEGTLVFSNATGYLVGVVASGANPFAGVAVQEYDNTDGTDGSINAELLADGNFVLKGSGFSQATVGLDIYATDNYTVQTSSSSASYVGRCVEYINSTTIVVAIRKNAPTTPLAANASGTTAATFVVDSDLGKPKTAIGSQTGGTGDYKLTILPPATLTADRTLTALGDFSGSIRNNAAFAATPNSSAGAGNTIPAGYQNVAVGAPANNADDFVVLPAIAGYEIGEQIRIACNGASNFELRTPASSNTTINDVDADGSQEYLCTDTDLVIVTKHTTTGWIAQSLTKLGAVRTAVVPD